MTQDIAKKKKTITPYIDDWVINISITSLKLSNMVFLMCNLQSHYLHFRKKM